MFFHLYWSVIVLVIFGSFPVAVVGAAAEGDPYPVKITKDVPYLDLTHLHEGKTVRLQRDQDVGAQIDFDYAYVARPCLPFCIQPMQLQGGIETVGVLEVIDYLCRINAGDDFVLVIDTWIRNADAALERAKAQGGDQCRSFSLPE